MKITCPKCTTSIPPSQMNLATDVAACPRCGEVFALSSLVASQDIPPEFDINDPPNGAWFYEDFRGWRIGASTRSAMAFFLIPFMCVWSGFSLGGIYGSQIAKNEFSLAMSLFGLPFLLGTLCLGAAAVMSICGRVEVIVADNSGRLFTGVGPIGWARRFDWSEVDRIEEDFLGKESGGNNSQVISMVGKTRLKFGSMMSESRRYYLLQGLRLLRSRHGKMA